MSTTIVVTEQVIDINVTTSIIDVNTTTQQINIEVAGAYPLPATVYSVFGRVGYITAQSGDYNTLLVTENTNLYFTNARSRSAISLTTIGTSGAATYDSGTGVLNVPQYQGGVTSFNTRTGAITLTSTDVTTALGFTPYNATNPNGYISGITSSMVTTALGYTPVTNARTLTINGVTYDLTADRSWTIAGGVSSVFGRTGAVVATSGDYTTTQVTEGTNLYYTDVRSRAALSFTAGSGAYNSTTGVITIPTNTNQLTNGSAYITLTSLSGSTGISYNNTTGAISSTITQYTDALSRGAISLTTTGTSGVSTYNSTTGVFNIPNYGSALSGYVPYTGASSDLNLGNKNLYTNNVFDGFSSVTASGTQIVLTVASVPNYLIIGSGGQTIKLPDATTLPNGANYVFNNNQSSGVILVNNNSNTLVKSIPSGGLCVLVLTDNSLAAGTWDAHFQAPSNVSWSTNTFDYVGSITGATWNGVVVAVNRGGTGQSTYTDGQLLIGNTTGNTLTKSTLTAGTGISITNGAGSISIASTITQYTNALARASISLTTTGTSGASTYDSATGVLNIPQYSGGSGMVYPAAGIALSTGSAWGTSITDNSANWNTAYTNRITSLTTTGSSGASTLTSNVLNIPNYTLAGLGGQASSTNLTSLAGLTYVSDSFVKMTASGTFTLDTNTYYLNSNPSSFIALSSAITGYTVGTNTALVSTDTLNAALGKLQGQVSARQATLSGTINTIAYWDSATSIASLAVATYPSLTELSYVKGVTSAIQTQLNAKQGTITLTTTGTSGAATLISGTLNIPQYSGGGGMAIGSSITSATAGSVLFAGASGVLAQNNANFFWDDTNNRLGLGTTSPSSTIDVSGNNSSNFQFRVGSLQVQSYAFNNILISDNMYYNGTSWTRTATGYGFGYQSTTGQFFFHGVDTGTGTFTQNIRYKFDYNGNFAIGNNISNVLNTFTGATLLFNSSSNLGLGTITIGSKLQVNGNAAIGYSASTAAPSNGLAVSGSVAIGQSAAASTVTVDILSTKTVLQAIGSSALDTTFVLKNTSTTFTNSLIYGYTTKTSNSNFKLLDLRTNNGSSQVFNVDGNGSLVSTSTITSTQYNISALNTAPATATSTGTLGEIRFTSGAIYVCTATNVWVRALLTTF